jgi:hypothetical protein
MQSVVAEDLNAFKIVSSPEVERGSISMKYFLFIVETFLKRIEEI